MTLTPNQALRTHRGFKPARAFPSAGEALLRLGRRCDGGLVGDGGAPPRLHAALLGGDGGELPPLLRGGSAWWLALGGSGAGARLLDPARRAATLAREPSPREAPPEVRHAFATADASSLKAGQRATAEEGATAAAAAAASALRLRMGEWVGLASGTSAEDGNAAAAVRVAADTTRGAQAHTLAPSQQQTRDALAELSAAAAAGGGAPPTSSHTSSTLVSLRWSPLVVCLARLSDVRRLGDELGEVDAALLHQLAQGPSLPPPHSGLDSGLGGATGGGGEQAPRRALLRDAARELGLSLGVVADVARRLAEGGAAAAHGSAAPLLFDAVLC